MSKRIILVVLILLSLLSSQSISSHRINLELIEGTDIFTKGDYITVFTNVSIDGDSFNFQIQDVVKSTYNGLDNLGKMEFNETRYNFETSSQEHAKTYLDPIDATMDIDCDVDVFGDPANISYEFWPQSDQFVNGSQVFEGNYYNITVIDSGLFQIGNNSIETWIANGRALDSYADINLTMDIMKSNGLTLAFHGYAQTSGSYTCDGTYTSGVQRIEINSTTVGLKLNNYGINTTSQYSEYLDFDPTEVLPEPIFTSVPTSISTSSTGYSTSTDYTTLSTTKTFSSPSTISTTVLSNETQEITSNSLSSTDDETLELPFNYIFGIYAFMSILIIRKFKK